MNTSGNRVVRKHFRLNTAKVRRAQEILRAHTETETLDRALDFVIAEHKWRQQVGESQQPSSGVERSSKRHVGGDVSTIDQTIHSSQKEILPYFGSGIWKGDLKRLRKSRV